MLCREEQEEKVRILTEEIRVLRKQVIIQKFTLHPSTQLQESDLRLRIDEMEKSTQEEIAKDTIRSFVK